MFYGWLKSWHLCLLFNHIPFNTGVSRFTAKSLRQSETAGSAFPQTARGEITHPSIHLLRFQLKPNIGEAQGMSPQLRLIDAFLSRDAAIHFSLIRRGRSNLKIEGDSAKIATPFLSTRGAETTNSNLRKRVTCNFLPLLLLRLGAHDKLGKLSSLA